MMVRSRLGLAPWDVLHSGLTKHFPIDIGQALVIVSFVVMLAWIPLREVPGLGTISNAIVIGASADVFLSVLADAPGDRAARRSHWWPASRSRAWPRRRTSGRSSAAARGTA